MEEMMCYIPKTLEEALDIKSKHDVIVLAGGSDLMVSNKRTLGLTPKFDKPVMIVRNLPELKNIYINDKGECCIGSGCTSAQIAESTLCPWHLRQAASRMGAVALRNSATIAGNIANASPKGDTPGLAQGWYPQGQCNKQDNPKPGHQIQCRWYCEGLQGGRHRDRCKDQPQS